MNYAHSPIFLRLICAQSDCLHRHECLSAPRSSHPLIAGCQGCHQPILIAHVLRGLQLHGRIGVLCWMAIILRLMFDSGCPIKSCLRTTRRRTRMCTLQCRQTRCVLAIVFLSSCQSSWVTLVSRISCLKTEKQSMLWYAEIDPFQHYSRNFITIPM